MGVDAGSVGEQFPSPMEIVLDAIRKGLNMPHLDWVNEVVKCLNVTHGLNIELAAYGSQNSPQYLLITPKIPAKEIQAEVDQLIPEGTSYRYVESPKTGHIGLLKTSMASMGFMLDFDVKGRTGVVKLKGKEDFSYQHQEVIDNLLTTDGFCEEWTVQVNDTEQYRYNPRITRILSGNIRRDRPIGQDDVMDVQIMAQSCQSIDEFIACI